MGFASGRLGERPLRGRPPDTDPATLNIAPLSVGLQHADGLFADRTVILTGATLTVGDSFDMAAGALGFTGEGSPLDEHRCGFALRLPQAGASYT